jgi:hypothetical protein
MSELHSREVNNLLLHHHQRRGGMTRNSDKSTKRRVFSLGAASSFLEQCVEFHAISSKSAPRKDTYEVSVPARSWRGTRLRGAETTSWLTQVICSFTKQHVALLNITCHLAIITQNVVFGRLWVHISTRMSAVLTWYFCGFLSPSRQMPR